MQSFFQGVVPTLIGLLLVTTAIKYIGSSATSAFLAGVPGMAAILSMVFLNEYLGYIGIFGLLSLSPGILMLALIQPKVN